jgi:hypothetical protein
MLDGKPIRAVLTFDSANVKTGPMAQLWILRSGVAPHVAQRTGADASICGDCPFRPANGGGCYVVTFQGPRAVWEGARGKRSDLQGGCDALRELASRDAGRTAVLRLGAYGDPAALPARIITSLCAAVGNRVTGYTHQWRKPRAAYLNRICMASVESPRDALIAQSQGWRTFRVAGSAEPTGPAATVDGLMTGETACLNTTVGLTCRVCGLCNGTGPADKRRSIAIPAHGYAASKAASKAE